MQVLAAAKIRAVISAQGRPRSKSKQVLVAFANANLTQCCLLIVHSSKERETIMVATRRKRAADGSSSEEEENPQDANFTAQDDGGDDHGRRAPRQVRRQRAHVQQLLPPHARRQGHGHQQAQVVPRPPRIVDFISRLALQFLQYRQNPPARRAHDRRVQALPGSLVRELHDFPVVLEESKYQSVLIVFRSTTSRATSRRGSRHTNPDKLDHETILLLRPNPLQPFASTFADES